MGRFVSKTMRGLASLMTFFSPKHRSAKRRWLFAFAVLAIVAIIAIPGQVGAQGLTDIADGILQVFSEIMLALARLFIALSVFALKFFIEIAQYNGYVDTPTVVLGWTMVRDVANMFFVVILLVIAFATILGIEQYEWKKTLVKLVLAAVFINFSKLIAGIVIDFAHVFTITFLNAVSATAGGNLINMFHLNNILRITGREFGQGDRINIEIFIGAVVAFIFAGMTLISMGAYLLVIVARVVVLWALIILSPVAFIFQVLPTTQQWAKEWWSRFGKQVLVAPVMVFFLWLSFATLGTGQFASQPIENGGLGLNFDTSEAESVLSSGKQKISISDVSTWENMANFFIAMAFLFVGLGVVQKLGVVGGGVVSGFVGFGKRVASIATGYAAGRWLVGRGRERGEGILRGAGAKLAEATRIPHAARVVGERAKQRYYGSFLGRGALRREASLENYRQITAKIKERQAAIGDLRSRAASGLAKATIEAENAKRLAAADYGVTEGQMRVSIILKQKRDENRRFQAAKEEALRGRAPGVDLTPQEEAKLHQQVADAMWKEGEELPAIALREATAGAKTGKAATELDIVARRAKDIDRMTENKLAKYIREFEDGEFNADIKSFAVMGYDARIQEVQRQMKIVKDIRDQYGADLAGVPESEKKAVKDAYKNGMRNIQLLLTSAFEQGEGNEMMQYAVVPFLDIPNQVKENWNDKERLGQFIQMAVTQGSVFDAAGNFDINRARQEEELGRNITSDKWNLTMRGLMRAMNMHAARDSNPTAFNQIRAGVNRAGVETLGFANNMEAGEVQSSAPGRLATGQTRNGVSIRQGKQEYLSGEIQRISQIKDGRAIIHIDGTPDGIATKVVDDTAKKMLRSVARLTTSEIRSLHRSVLNMLSGGGYDKSSYDSVANAFRPISAEMETMFRGVIEDMKTGIQEASTAGNRQTYDRRFEALQELIFQMSGERKIRNEIENIEIGGNRIGTIATSP